MRKFKILFLAIIGSVLLSSCGKPSLEEDAQTAAELSNISNQRALDSDFSGAEKYYRDAQEIIDKYRNTDKFKDFFTLYNGFLEAGAYKQMESYVKEENQIEKNGF